MKINAVKFKDKKSFEKNKTKSNVLAVYESFGIIVFEDQKPVVPEVLKVSQVYEVDKSQEAVPTGLAICMMKDYEKAIAYLDKEKIQIIERFKDTSTAIVEVPEFMNYDLFYAKLFGTGLFISIEQDNIMPVEATNEMTYSGHWHLSNLKAAEAWALLPDGVVREVAVLDIACEINHEDLAGRISSTSWNCVFDTPDVQPISAFENHGTPCAGVICAATDNSIGCKSIGNNHLNVQFLHIGMNSSSSGSFMTSDTILVRAMNKVLSNPNCVAVSMSWSGGNAYPMFGNMLSQARTTGRGGKGIPCFASSGNGNQPNFQNFPASFPQVMAVGAIGQNNTRAFFSNYGPKLFAAAPGVALYTTDRVGANGYGPETYRGFSGTSASCPAMAAVAGLVLVKNPELSEADVRQILKDSCNKVGGYVYDANGRSAELGWGAIDLFTAVSKAGGTDPTPPKPPMPYNLFGVISTPASTVAGQQVLVSYTVNVDRVLENDLSIPVTLSFKSSTGSPFNFYSGNVNIVKGQTSVTMNNLYTVPNNLSGPCTFTLSIDPINIVQESNESDNTAITTINVVAPAPPSGTPDLSIQIERYEWLDAERVRIFFKVTNVGSVPVTSWRCVNKWDGKPSLTWNRAETINPGRWVGGGTVQPMVLWGTMPNTFRMEITAVNGAPDNNSTNNVATVTVTR